MKNKENCRKKKSQQKNKSISCDRGQKKSNFTSMIFQSGRNSLCSPRDAKNVPSEKYQNYMQYISSGKFMLDFAPQKTGCFANRRNSITPTPKRISTSLMEQGRKSLAGKENSMVKGCERNNSFLKHQAKSPKSKSKPLFVKGNNIIKVEDNHHHKEESKRKDSRPASAKKKGNNIKKVKNEEKDDLKEKKLVEKLFSGIQFYRDLGKGAHALVKSGVDWNSKRKIAIKVYDKTKLKDEQMNSINREVEILGQLNHPNIIKLYEIIQTYKTINLVMQYGGGNSVEQYLRNKKKGYLEEAEARDIFREILEGVEFMHENRVAHRDIKPENVLLNKYLKVKIIDFGFSLRVDSNAIINQYCGTPTYMAPEVVSKTPHNPFFADRWSLGILLYTMLNGHCPFKAQTQKQLFVKICEGVYDFEPFVSEASAQFISLFLKKNPQERVDLREALNHKWMQQ